MRVLIWYHRDLRTHDHEGLTWAVSGKHEIEAIAFQPPAGHSLVKRKFWQETAQNLGASLKSAGIPLTISAEDPLIALSNYVKAHEIERVITHRRMNFRDQLQVEQIESQLTQQLGQKLMVMGDPTLYSAAHVAELSLSSLKPFTKFKNFAIENWSIPASIPRPQNIQLASSENSDWSHGGESSGLSRLEGYIWQTHACKHYHETRNGMILRDDSSKLSRWLSIGAISVRLVFEELRKFEDKNGSSDGAAHLIYELIWRDYFKFLASITKDKYFSQQGLRESPLDLIDDPNLFEAWQNGTTGDDFVDANMRELLLTGWMSGRGRQNVASYLAKTLHLNWVAGAEWFEQQLVDDDPENNWGNWQYLAGVGTDPRDRRLDVKHQAAVYDSEEKYRDLWLR